MTGTDLAGSWRHTFGTATFRGEGSASGAETSEDIGEASVLLPSSTGSQQLAIRVNTGPTKNRFPERPQAQAGGSQWEWDAQVKDFVRLGADGNVQYYTYYQKNMASPVSPNKESHGAYAAAQRRIVERSSSEYATSLASEAGAESDASQDSHADQASTSRRNSTESDRTSISSGESEVLPSYEGPLEDGFKRVDKPKRFFSIGRIFKTVWFEPGGDDTPARRSDIDWTESCPPYYEQRPYAKFRWFVVVRRRLHHSLCFSITASAGPGAARASRGRPIDFVVLHSSAVEPPDPFEGEGITRAPIAIIIEDEEAYISPLARIDCARIYTVEDNLQVLKVGRVHPDWLPKLEEYFKEAAA